MMDMDGLGVCFLCLSFLGKLHTLVIIVCVFVSLLVVLVFHEFIHTFVIFSICS